MSNPFEHSIRPVGFIKSPFKQKFGIPRQGIGLSSAKGWIEFESHIRPDDACKGIEDFSHLWLLFIFHQHTQKVPKDLVRPPRLGGNEKIGVFASRSSFRPNHIGMTVVKNLGFKNNRLFVQGIDLVDGTPIIDVKPYLQYADAIESAKSSYANQAPVSQLNVEIKHSFRPQLQECGVEIELLEEVLRFDPRPAYKANVDDNKMYAIQLASADIHFKVENQQAIVCKVLKID